MHYMHDDVVWCRYERGIFNFFRLYKEIMDAWWLFDSSSDDPAMIARGDREFADNIISAELWQSIHP